MENGKAKGAKFAEKKQRYANQVYNYAVEILYAIIVSICLGPCLHMDLTSKTDYIGLGLYATVYTQATADYTNKLTSMIYKPI